MNRLVPVLFALAAPLGAAEHTLFSPTPREAMRELSTDRPDTTESPITVDAGHVQVELEPVSWTRDRADGVDTTALDVSANLKVGLDDRTDLQLVLTPYARVHVRGGGVDERADGLGDTTVRLKRNLWGDDGGPTAFALLPYVDLPTHASELDEAPRHLGAGIVLPLGIDLGNGWGCAVQVDIGFARAADDQGWSTTLMESGTVSHAIVGDLSAFGELVVQTATDAGAEGEAYLDGGLVLGVGPDWQFDAGFNAGLTRASDDLRLFVGISARR